MDLSGYVEGMINFEGGGGGESFVPRPTQTDRNKYLGVKSDSNDLEYREVREVPSTDDVAVGNVLTRSASGDEWLPPVKELPTYTTEENNKVLGVHNGTLEWVEQSGGDSTKIITYRRTITTNAYGWWFVEDENNQPLYVDKYTLLSINCIVDNSSGTWRGIGVESFVDINQYRIRFQNINDGGFYKNPDTYTIEVSYIYKNVG